MKAIFDVGHPAHVHLFKNTIRNLSHSGWNVKVLARPKEITLELLNSYGFDYQVLRHYNHLFFKAIGMILIDIMYLKIARRFDPDILVSVGSPYSAHISAILRKPHIVFIDTPAKKNSLYYLSHHAVLKKLTKAVCTPDVYPAVFSQNKQIRYKGYHELAYLHPNYFTRDGSVLNEMGLTPQDKFIIMRFASLDALHDIRQKGFDNTAERIQFVKRLQQYCRVFVTSERPIPELKKYELTISPHKIHDLLAFATMYIGEGATMASEAGVLAVPWIFIYSKTLPYLDDQEKNHGLGFTVQDASSAFKICLDLLKRKNLRQEWLKKRDQLLKDKIDVTKFMTNVIMTHSKPSTQRQFIPDSNDTISPL